MTTMLVDLKNPLIQALVAVVIVGFLTVVSLIKLYTFITCGYYRKMTNMEGKTVIITGATGGIGKETARELAKRKARVILACRNVQNAAIVKSQIEESTKNYNVIVKKLDLSSQNSVRAFAKDILETESRLDVLIHNAGTAESKLRMTEDDLELTMATNHFGPFLLTLLLMPILRRSAPCRIVVVASELYRLTTLDLNNLNPRTSWFAPWIYYRSKYANILFTRELARRLEGTGIVANCLHPGMIDSGIWRNVPVPLNWPLKLIIKCFFKTPEQGCQTSVFLASENELEGITGKYFMDCREANLSANVCDMSRAKKLWELSEELVKLQPTDPKI